ncbi:MAG: methyltransferase domain-containing protein [Bacteroidetes bacterium]|nr:methyltransferase domain-containing protein [Bacteroidales bacterium]NJO70144.1 methyltransferase domain-containing protein [Bacteroidota bacterium]
MKKSLPNDAYDVLADSYNQMIETKPHNAYYERPAMQSLLPDVAGKTILDAGCGPGVYIKWLLEKGAEVTGIDANEKMLTHAQNRLGNAARLVPANMEEPLDMFADASFDGILSALAVTYVNNLDALFREFNRLLRPGAWFVFSTEHPFFTYNYHKFENYFETRQVSYLWKGFGVQSDMPSYYHCMGDLCNALTNNGFVIEKVIEPLPTENFRLADIRHYEELMKFPGFICFKARKI